MTPIHNRRIALKIFTHLFRKTLASFFLMVFHDTETLFHIIVLNDFFIPAAKKGVA